MGRIKDLPLLERPREKALRYGISSLSNDELIAILIGSGYKSKSALDIARELLSKYNGISNLLRVSQENLIEQKGISVASALRICSCFCLCNKLNLITENEPLNLTNAYQQISREYQRLLSFESQEQLHLICLDNRGRILKQKLIYIGTERTANASAREILKNALISGCKNIILVHNHPNGNPNPSDDDLIFTKSVIDECKRFNIKLFDHLIVYQNGVTSILSR